MGTEFNKEQFDAIYPEGIQNHYWTYARNKILNNVLSKTNKTNTILEVGCGKGIVVDYLFNKGFTINGVELAEIPIEEKLKSIVRSGVNVFDLSSSECEKIEVILLLDVIEHIEFPNDFLKQLVIKFPNLKNFIITVPACHELFSNYDEFNGHFRRYDQAMAKNDFKDIAYNKIEMSYFFHSLYVPAKLLLNTSGKRSEEIIAPKGFIKKLVHRVIANVFFLDFLLLPSKLKGTSLLIKIDLK